MNINIKRIIIILGIVLAVLNGIYYLREWYCEKSSEDCYPENV